MSITSIFSGLISSPSQNLTTILEEPHAHHPLKNSQIRNQTLKTKTSRQSSNFKINNLKNLRYYDSEKKEKGRDFYKEAEELIEIIKEDSDNMSAHYELHEIAKDLRYKIKNCKDENEISILQKVMRDLKEYVCVARFYYVQKNIDATRSMMDKEGALKTILRLKKFTENTIKLCRNNHNKELLTQHHKELVLLHNQSR